MAVVNAIVLEGDGGSKRLSMIQKDPPFCVGGSSIATLKRPS